MKNLIIVIITTMFCLSCSDTHLCEEVNTTYIGEGTYLNKQVTFKIDIYEEVNATLSIIFETGETFAQGGVFLDETNISFDIVPANHILYFAYTHENSLGLLKNEDNVYILTIKK